MWLKSQPIRTLLAIRIPTKQSTRIFSGGGQLLCVFLLLLQPGPDESPTAVNYNLLRGPYYCYSCFTSSSLGQMIPLRAVSTNLLWRGPYYNFLNCWWREDQEWCQAALTLRPDAGGVHGLATDPWQAGTLTSSDGYLGEWVMGQVKSLISLYMGQIKSLINLF